MTREGTHILLVEDNQDDIDLTLRALRQHKLVSEVVVVKDGAEALDYLFARGSYKSRNPEEVPQLVLLDVNLPKLSGLDVLKQLRQDARTKLLPVVMLTTSREERDVAESYANGANSYVQKPVDFAAFTEAVRQLGVYWLMLNETPWHARA